MQAAISCFQKNGYGLIKNFLSRQQCKTAIQQINKLIESYEPTPETSTVFSTTDDDRTRTKDYFLNSSDKVSFFLQKQAYKDGKLIFPKLQSINKIGHALHQHNNIFKKITYNQQIGEICRHLKIKNPVVMQSMAILKPPKIGGEVVTHQDSTFLYDEPETLVGFWIPLQQASVQNGCLWGLPGSHLGKLYERSKMNWSQKSAKMEKMHSVDYKDSDFIPIEMERGSLIFFSGRFLHKSNPNYSAISRYAYTFHVKSGDTKWAEDNWLQRKSFPMFEFNEKSA